MYGRVSYEAGKRGSGQWFVIACVPHGECYKGIGRAAAAIVEHEGGKREGGMVSAFTVSEGA